MPPAAEGALETCKHMLSPGLLKRCRIYCRNDDVAPERCWDESVSMVPEGMGRICPNHTGRARKGGFPKTWEEELEALKQRYYAKIRTWARTPPEGEIKPEPEPEFEPEDHPIEEEGNP
jgi:hypothetical protein